MKVLEKFKNIELLEVSDGQYAVRKSRRWFGPTYFNVNRNGTDITFASLVGGVTVTDDLRRAIHIYSCNAIKAGYLK